jgi:hypothetical protein
MMSSKGALAAELARMPFPFLRERPYSSHFFGQALRLLACLPFGEGIGAAVEAALALPLPALLRLMRAALRSVPSRELLLMIGERILPVLPARVGVVALARLIAVHLDIAAPPDAVAMLAGVVRLLQGVVALPGIGEDAVAAIFDQPAVNIGVLQLCGDAAVAQLIGALFEVVGSPARERTLVAYFAFFTSFLDAVDSPEIAPPPPPHVFLNFLDTAHGANVQLPRHHMRRI